MAAFTEVARAVSQILVHHHDRQASDVETLSGVALLGDCFYYLLLHWSVSALFTKAETIRGTALMGLWFTVCIYSYIHTLKFFSFALISV